MSTISSISSAGSYIYSGLQKAGSQASQGAKKIQQGAQHIQQGVKKGLQQTYHGLQYGAQAGKQYAKKLYIAIPGGYDANLGNGLFDVVQAIADLDIEVEFIDQNKLAIAQKTFATAEQFLGITERGLTLFLPQLDNFLQKHNKVSQAVGGSAESALGKVVNGQLIVSGIQSVLSSALAGVELNDIIKRGGTDLELAQASVALVSELVGNLAVASQTVEAFQAQISNIGKFVEGTKGLGGIGQKLQHISGSGLHKAGLGFDIITSLLSGVTAGFALADKNASTGTKVAAGFEISNQVIGGITKAVSSYILAQRLAAGLSTTGPAAALIASSVSLAISPLAFLRVANNFERSNELREFAERFKKLGYEGDSLLADFYKESGIIDASITTISTALSAISAGTAAASAGALVGAPITLLVTGITGLISGILEFSKQPLLEGVATKLAGKIDEWEKKYGKNYFENGYDARHSAFLEDTLSLFETFSKEARVDRSVLITQQHWDEYIGELAGITRQGDRVTSGKTYVNFFEEGKLLEQRKNEFKDVVFDPEKGVIDISESDKSTLLKFINPLLTPGTETRERQQTGKYEYVTKLIVNNVKEWTVNGVKNESAVYDFSNVTQHIYNPHDVERYREIRVVANLGNSSDKVFVAAGSTTINAGDGHDIVYYDKTDTGTLEIDASNATTQGEYTVKRHLGRNTKILLEDIKTQEVNVGKRAEKIQYRSADLSALPADNIFATDYLHSVEEIIGSNNKDEFKGSKFKDIFHGADGNDRINGNDGNDVLFGDNGDDELRGDNGDDQLYGGAGKDQLFGGNGNNYLSGGDGDDELQVLGNGFNVLRGGKGEDKLYGGTGADYLEGGEGNDHLQGGEGSDVYVYNSSSGRDVIQESGSNKNGSKDTDKLYLSDLSLRDLVARRLDDNLELRYYTKDHRDDTLVVIKDWFKTNQDHNHQVEQIIDKDGNKITAEQIKQYFDDQAFSSSLDYYHGDQNRDRNLAELKTEVHKIISAAGNFITETKGRTLSDFISSNVELKDLVNSLTRATA